MRHLLLPCHSLSIVDADYKHYLGEASTGMDFGLDECQALESFSLQMNSHLKYEDACKLLAWCEALSTRSLKTVWLDGIEQFEVSDEGHAVELNRMVDSLKLGGSRPLIRHTYPQFKWW